MGKLGIPSLGELRPQHGVQRLKELLLHALPRWRSYSIDIHRWGNMVCLRWGSTVCNDWGSYFAGGAITPHGIRCWGGLSIHHWLVWTACTAKLPILLIIRC